MFAGIEVMNIPATQFIQRTYQQPYRAAIAQRIEKKDTLVPNNSAESYNSFVWALATKFTSSREEAEAAVKEMLSDIKRCAESSVDEPPIENRLTARLAFQRLLKFLQ